MVFMALPQLPSLQPALTRNGKHWLRADMTAFYQWMSPIQNLIDRVSCQVSIFTYPAMENDLDRFRDTI